jgi:hypothetical protein
MSPCYAAQFSPAITVICDQRCVRVEPELRAAIRSVGVRVSRLTAVVRVEMEAIGSHSQNRRHRRHAVATEVPAKSYPS